MFSTLTAQLRSQVDTVKRVLTTNDLLRSLLYVSSALPAAASEASTSAGVGGAYVQTLEAVIHSESLPNKLQWQIHDHCAAFTRLYASYEQFIVGLVSDYLQFLPNLYGTYADLPLAIQTQHRIGTGQILVKLGSGQYKELEEHVVLDHLVHCVPGDPSYKLLAEAFLVERQNYRFDMLVRLLASLGVENAGPAILRNTGLQDFMKTRRGEGANVQKELDDFIQFRNEAAHTSVENILGTEEIKVIADFMTALCECLSEIVSAVVVRRRMALGHYSSIGTVIETHYGGRVVIVDMEEASIAVRDEVIVLRKGECFLAEVESIRVDDGALDVLHATRGQEVGVGLSRKVKNASALRRLSLPVQAGVSSEEASKQELLFELPASGDSTSTDVAEEHLEDISDSTSDDV